MKRIKLPRGITHFPRNQWTIHRCGRDVFRSPPGAHTLAPLQISGCCLRRFIRGLGQYLSGRWPGQTGGEATWKAPNLGGRIGVGRCTLSGGEPQLRAIFAAEKGKGGDVPSGTGIYSVSAGRCPHFRSRTFVLFRAYSSPCLKSIQASTNTW
jgi:hypothetical protein